MIKPLNRNGTYRTYSMADGLAGVTKLERFLVQGTGLCAPLDPAFQAWLQGIATTSGSNCSE